MYRGRFGISQNMFHRIICACPKLGTSTALAFLLLVMFFFNLDHLYASELREASISLNDYTLFLIEQLRPSSECWISLCVEDTMMALGVFSALWSVCKLSLWLIPRLYYKLYPDVYLYIFWKGFKITNICSYHIGKITNIGSYHTVNKHLIKLLLS